MNPEMIEQAISVPNTFPAMFWGYAAIWSFYCIYLFVLVRRVNHLSRNKQS